MEISGKCKQMHRLKTATHRVWFVVDTAHPVYAPLRHFKLDTTNLYAQDANDSVFYMMITHKVARTLQNHLRKTCTHLKNHGGRKKTAYHVQQRMGNYPYIYRSDVKSYYASINLWVLYNQVCTHIQNRFIQRAVYQYTQRMLDINGNLYPPKGIPMGCALSPLMGALYLHPLDVAMENRKDIFYIRYMDDYVIMGKTKNAFRAAVKRSKQILKELHLEEHPDKTFYLRNTDILEDTIVEEKITQEYLERIVDAPDVGFDFLGYHISRTGIRLRRETAAKMLENKYYNPKPKKQIPDWLKETHWDDEQGCFARKQKNRRLPKKREGFAPKGQQPSAQIMRDASSADSPNGNRPCTSITPPTLKPKRFVWQHRVCPPFLCGPHGAVAQRRGPRSCSIPRAPP